MFTIPSTTKLLVLQATPFCNLGCEYCYLSSEERDDTSRMSEETLEKLLDFVKQSNYLSESLTVLWHAGEPLAVPIDFYRRAFKTITKKLPGTSIRFNFQTNATTLNQEWCDFLLENHVSIGVSIDGPKSIHDSRRVTKKGKGTFERAMKGIDILKRNNVPFATISVVTDASLDHPIEIVDFLLSLNPVSIGFNIEENERHYSDSNLDKNRLEKFVEKVCDTMYKKGVLDKCREFKETANAIMRLDATDNGIVRTESVLNGILSVSWDGKVSTYSPELAGFFTEQYGEFSFGNVSDSFTSYANSKKLIEVTNDIKSGISKCKETCDYYRICGGGSPSNKLQENKSFISTETVHCFFHNQLFADQFIKFSKLN